MMLEFSAAAVSLLDFSLDCVERAMTDMNKEAD